MASTLAADATVDDLHTLTGQRWPWLFTRGADLLAADTPTEICQLLIDDYHQIPAGVDGDRDALLARWGFACGLAQQLQETLAGLAANRDLWQPGDPAHHAGTLAGIDTDAGVEEILLGDRSQPVDQVADWQHPVPLILCTLDYAPPHAAHPARRQHCLARPLHRNQPAAQPHHRRTRPALQPRPIRPQRGAGGRVEVQDGYPNTASTRGPPPECDQNTL